MEDGEGATDYRLYYPSTLPPCSRRT
jgi:hypothetical protein